MPNKVNASHILVKSETEALAIMHDIRNNKSFEQVAQEKSLCPSKKRGGSLGWFSRGHMVPEFEKAAFSGKKGDIIKVKTQFGWHVIKINDVE